MKAKLIILFSAIALVGYVVLWFGTDAFGADVVIKTGNLKSCNARLKQLGIVVRGAEDDGTPQAWRDEERYEQTSTPMLTDVDGKIYFTIRLTDEQAAKLPKNDTPNFATIWDSRETDQDGNFLPWPVVTVPAYDLNGQPAGTQLQGVPVIAR